MARDRTRTRVPRRSAAREGGYSACSVHASGASSSFLRAVIRLSPAPAAVCVLQPGKVVPTWNLRYAGNAVGTRFPACPLPVSLFFLGVGAGLGVDPVRPACRRRPGDALVCSEPRKGRGHCSVWAGIPTALTGLTTNAAFPVVVFVLVLDLGSRVGSRAGFSTGVYSGPRSWPVVVRVIVIRDPAGSVHRPCEVGSWPRTSRSHGSRAARHPNLCKRFLDRPESPCLLC